MKYSKRSLRELSSSNFILQMLFKEAIKIIDITIIQGKRGQEEQDKLYEEDKSKVKYPNSKHNTEPSDAIDFAPYPIDYDNNTKARARFYYTAGILRGIFYRLKEEKKVQKGIDLRFGLDWDGDNEFSDQTFDDLGHVEIIDIEAEKRNKGYRAGIY